jgi:hypothetical protein
MRASLAAVFVACVCTGAAWAGGPGDVYNDYAADGKLSCNHSRADLVAVLRSGSLNQYGDPLTLARLKLAVRKQLAGGCRPARRAGSPRRATGGGAASGGGGTSYGQTPRSSKKASPTRHPRRRGGGKLRAPAQVAPSRLSAGGGDSASFAAGQGLIIGLVVAAVAFGGWLTKRALAARD